MINFLRNTGCLNTPTLVYFIRNKKILRLQNYHLNHKTKNINGILIDENIPTHVIKSLLKNSKIEMRYSCEGCDIYGPFFVFALNDFYDHDNTDKFCQMINNSSNKIVCKYSKGKENKFRIVMTSTFTKNEVDEIECVKWWEESNEKICEVLKEIYGQENTDM